MATPGELVKVIAAATGEDEVSVTQFDRDLMAAGLRSKSGRGRSAAKVTPQDAARLFTALLGSHRIKDGVETVQRYMQTQEHRAHWAQHWPADKQGGMGPENVWEKYGIPQLTALPPDHNFVDALTVLITLASEGILIKELGDMYKFEDIKIIVKSPRAHARISMYRHTIKETDKSKSVQADYGSSAPPPDWLVDLSKPYPKDQGTVSPKLDRWSEMNAMPIIYVGALLAGRLDELPKIEVRS